MKNDPNVPLTNTNMPAMSFAHVHRMSDEQFGYALQQWHGGGGSALYSVGSSLGAKHLEIFKKQDVIQGALKELEEVYEDPESCYGDKMETIALADELRFRNQKYMGNSMHNNDPKTAKKKKKVNKCKNCGSWIGPWVVTTHCPDCGKDHDSAGKDSDDAAPSSAPSSGGTGGGDAGAEVAAASMESWIKSNCKFAVRKTASLFDNLSEQEQARVIGDPSSLIDVLKGAYQRMGNSFSVPLTQQDIMMDLHAIDQRAFPGQGAVFANPATAKEVMEIARGVTNVAPARQPAPQQKQVIPDPFDTFRQTRGR